MDGHLSRARGSRHDGSVAGISLWRSVRYERDEPSDGGESCDCLVKFTPYMNTMPEMIITTINKKQ